MKFIEIRCETRYITKELGMKHFCYMLTNYKFSVTVSLMPFINISDIPYGSSKQSSAEFTVKQKTETFSGTATDLCKRILERSCEYCKLTCIEMESEYLFYRYEDKQHKYPIYHDKDALLDKIFVEFIKKNTNTNDTIIVISSYLNNLKP